MQPGSDKRYNVAFYADEHMPADYLKSEMDYARSGLANALIDSMMPGKWYAVRWSWSVFPDHMWRRKEYRLTYELNEAQEQVLIMPPSYADMRPLTLVFTAWEEMQRRWRWRFSSGKRFLDWFERANGWA